MKRLVYVLTILLLVFAISFSQTKDVITVYDGETEATNLSAVGKWIAPEGCKIEETSELAYSGKNSIKVYFTWSAWWAGMGINFANWNLESGKVYDLSQYKSLEFYIYPKGEVPGKLMITLVEAPKEASGKSIYSAKYDLPLLTPNKWNKVTVPLKSIIGVDLKRIWEMTIEVTGTPSGEFVLYVDDISFVK